MIHAKAGACLWDIGPWFCPLKQIDIWSYLCEDDLENIKVLLALTFCGRKIIVCSGWKWEHLGSLWCVLCDHFFYQGIFLTSNENLSYSKQRSIEWSIVGEIRHDTQWTLARIVVTKNGISKMHVIETNWFGDGNLALRLEGELVVAKQQCHVIPTNLSALPQSSSHNESKSTTFWSKSLSCGQLKSSTLGMFERFFSNYVWFEPYWFGNGDVLSTFHLTKVWTSKKWKWLAVWIVNAILTMNIKITFYQG